MGVTGFSPQAFICLPLLHTVLKECQLKKTIQIFLLYFVEKASVMEEIHLEALLRSQNVESNKCLGGD